MKFLESEKMRKMSIPATNHFVFAYSAKFSKELNFRGLVF